MSLKNKELQNKITKPLFLIYIKYFQGHPRFANSDATVNIELSKQKNFHVWSNIMKITSTLLVLTLIIYLLSPAILSTLKVNINTLRTTVIFVVMYVFEAGSLLGISLILKKIENDYWKNKRVKSLKQILSDSKLLNVEIIDDFISELEKIITKEKKSVENKFTLLRWFLGVLLTILSIFAGLEKTRYTSELIGFIITISVVIVIYVFFKVFFGERIGGYFLNRLHNLEFLKLQLRNVKVGLIRDHSIGAKGNK